MVFAQETDQSTVSPPERIRPQVEGSPVSVMPDRTYADFPDIDIDYLSPELSDALRSAKSFVREVTEEPLRIRATRLLSTLHSVLSLIHQSGANSIFLPILLPSRDDDGSLLFEWTRPNFRIGFNIDQDPMQSGWYLFTGHELGDIAASGHVSEMELDKLALWLVFFMAMQS